MSIELPAGFAATLNGHQEDQNALPIFDVQRVQLRFDISSDFVAAQVANNVLILALSSGRLLRFDLDNAEDIDGERILPSGHGLTADWCTQTSIFPNDQQR